MNSNWVFVPVHKTRIIKELEKAFLIQIDENVSTILPKVFLRKKQTETHLFFSIPADFNIGVRYSTYNMDKKRYEHKDVLKSITCDEMKRVLKALSYEYVSAEVKEKALEDSPF